MTYSMRSCACLPKKAPWPEHYSTMSLENLLTHIVPCTSDLKVKCVVSSSIRNIYISDFSYCEAAASLKAHAFEGR